MTPDERAIGRGLQLNTRFFKEINMGEISDDIIEGLSCSGCGVYFDEAHGYPVLCHGCWDSWMPFERKRSGLQLACSPLIGEDNG